MPQHYRTLDVSQHIGVGSEWFRTAAERLMSWDMHRRAGLLVHAPHRVTLRAIAVLEIRLGLWWVQAPVRVVDVVEEATVRGFA